MTTVRYTGEGGRYRAGGVNFEPGDEADVPDGLAEHLVDTTGEFEYVEDLREPEVDEDDLVDTLEGDDAADEETDEPETKGSVVTAPAEFTIDEIEAELETGEWDDHLDTLLENEEDGNDRTGVHDAIGVRRAEIED